VVTNDLQTGLMMELRRVSGSQFYRLPLTSPWSEDLIVLVTMAWTAAEKRSGQVDNDAHLTPGVSMAPGQNVLRHLLSETLITPQLGRTSSQLINSSEDRLVIQTGHRLQHRTSLA